MTSRSANTRALRARNGVALLVVLLALAACDVGSEGNETVFVSAAASLTDAFTRIGVAFERANPGTDVILNFGGSSTLREQILEGVPADVYASANMANMDQVVSAVETAGDPVIFAQNQLEIAVPSGNPADVTGLEDFSDEDLLIGLCAAPVPCGAFARDVLDNAGVVPAIDTNEPDVRALLTKVEVGELDAGITYVTDIVATEGSVEGVEIPRDFNVVAEYPIAVLSQQQTADGFVDFVLSDVGQSILRELGFGVS